MMLEALSHFAAARVLGAIEARQTAEGALPERIAALYVYSTFGSAKHLPRLLELALRPNDKALASDAGDALEFAVTSILQRDPKGFAWLQTEAERTPAELQPRLVFAIGATRNPLGIAVFARLLMFHRELAEVILPTRASSADRPTSRPTARSRRRSRTSSIRTASSCAAPPCVPWQSSATATTSAASSNCSRARPRRSATARCGRCNASAA
jgi:hypothetical protein